VGDHVPDDVLQPVAHEDDIEDVLGRLWSSRICER
jgi:hypothetical protein